MKKLHVAVSAITLAMLSGCGSSSSSGATEEADSQPAFNLTSSHVIPNNVTPNKNDVNVTPFAEIEDTTKISWIPLRYVNENIERFARFYVDTVNFHEMPTPMFSEELSEDAHANYRYESDEVLDGTHFMDYQFVSYSKGYVLTDTAIESIDGDGSFRTALANYNHDENTDIHEFNYSTEISPAFAYLNTTDCNGEAKANLFASVSGKYDTGTISYSLSLNSSDDTLVCNIEANPDGSNGAGMCKRIIINESGEPNFSVTPLDSEFVQTIPDLREFKTLSKEDTAANVSKQVMAFLEAQLSG